MSKTLIEDDCRKAEDSDDIGPLFWRILVPVTVLLLSWQMCIIFLNVIYSLRDFFDFISILNAPFISLSIIASAIVLSPIISYHTLTGS